MKTFLSFFVLLLSLGCNSPSVNNDYKLATQQARETQDELIKEGFDFYENLLFETRDFYEKEQIELISILEQTFIYYESDESGNVSKESLSKIKENITPLKNKLKKTSDFVDLKNQQGKDYLKNYLKLSESIK